MIHKFSLQTRSGVEPDAMNLREMLELPDLEVWRDYYVEFGSEPMNGELALLCDALGDQFDTQVSIDRTLGDDCIMITHRRGVVDNENDTIMAMCRLLNIEAVAGKVATTYRSSSARLGEILAATRFNSTIEELHRSEPCFQTLVPAGVYLSAERYDLCSLEDASLSSLGRENGRNLSPAQMQRIREIQQALDEPFITEVLLEALDARWSDHCSHTTWKSLGGLLDRLMAASRDTANPNIVSMFFDNAGVWSFYNGYALAIKAETHNGPSAISAYFGQLTKLGGVLRDIMGTGLAADPIGCYEYTATGLPEEPAPIKGRPGARQIAQDTIRAIKEYGNTFGVPMMWSHMTFHPSYRAKPFALGGSIGVLPAQAAERGRPMPGDLVVLIGGLTGNEGIHGASASSVGGTMDEASVQIGAPLEQVKFRNALTALRDAGCLRALTDIGGAGLNSAVGEIGEACGIWINTALVPLKTSALPMWRILLSESQERMLLAVPPAEEPAARRILEQHQVRSTVIGRFCDSRRYCVFHSPDLDEQTVIGHAPNIVPSERGEPGFDVPYALLDVPVLTQETGPPPPVHPTSRRWPGLDVGDVPKILEQVIGDPEIASQLYADSQYDSTVQGNTVHGPRYGRGQPVPSGYWAGTPIDGVPAAAVVSSAFNPWLFDIDPVRALRQMFCGLIASQVTAGVDLRDICLCDNFYTPHLTEHWREWLVGMVDELCLLVRHFGTPVISGKDSSAGSTHTDEGVVSVPPAVFLTALGKVPHYERLLREQWTTPGNLLLRIGPETPAPAGTVAARALGIVGGGIDNLSLDEVDGYLTALSASRHLFRSGTRIGAGGLATHLILGCLASGLGVEADLLAGHPSASLAENLFAEHRCASLVEVEEASLALLLPAGLNATVVGRLTDRASVRLGDMELFTSAIARTWATSFEGRLT